MYVVNSTISQDSFQMQLIAMASLWSRLIESRELISTATAEKIASGELIDR